MELAQRQLFVPERSTVYLPFRGDKCTTLVPEFTSAQVDLDVAVGFRGYA
jgi:hypothetical protein